MTSHWNVSAASELAAANMACAAELGAFIKAGTAKLQSLIEYAESQGSLRKLAVEGLHFGADPSPAALRGGDDGDFTAIDREWETKVVPGIVALGEMSGVEIDKKLITFVPTTSDESPRRRRRRRHKTVKQANKLLIRAGIGSYLEKIQADYEDCLAEIERLQRELAHRVRDADEQIARSHQLLLARDAEAGRLREYIDRKIKKDRGDDMDRKRRAFARVYQETQRLISIDGEISTLYNSIEESHAIIERIFADYRRTLQALIDRCRDLNAQNLENSAMVAAAYRRVQQLVAQIDRELLRRLDQAAVSNLRALQLRMGITSVDVDDLINGGSASSTDDSRQDDNDEDDE